MNLPLVSVIVPCYNHGQFVEKTLRSIFAQTYKNFEVIVIDDGSKDNSTEVLQKLKSEFSFHLITKENEGVCKTLNRGLSLAKGELITILASDDTMPPHRLNQQVQSMLEMPDADVVAGSVLIIDKNDKVIGEKSPRKIGSLDFNTMIRTNCVLAPTAMIRKSTYDKYGTYNPEFLIEDLYMWLKVLSHGGRIVNVDKVWAYYRVLDGNQEKRFEWYFKGISQVLTSYLPDQNVERALRYHHFIFSAKMAFLKGRQIFSEYRSSLEQVSFLQRAIVTAIAHTPAILRKKIMQAILTSY